MSNFIQNSNQMSNSYFEHSRALNCEQTLNGCYPTSAHMYRVIILFFINLLWPKNVHGDMEKLHPIKSWKSLDFAFPNAYARQQAIDNGEFIPGAPVPIDFGVIPTLRGKMGKILVTVPRFQKGVPVTLGYITEKISKENNPLIAPYPNWQMNKLDRNCNHIVSVFRIAIDECNRLWILDTGRFIDDQICLPKLLVFNLFTDQLISTYKFPTIQFHNDSIFITPIVDIRNKQCDKAFVYIADVVRYQLIVYDHENRKSWNIKNEYFKSERQHSNFTINNESFTLADGIFALTLSPINFGDRYLFFHSLASLSENYVLTSVIRNSKLFEKNPYSSGKSFQRFLYKRPSQSSSEIMDERGILFYPLLSQTALACWNSKSTGKFDEHSTAIITQNSETLQFPSSMKIFSTKGQRDQLWLMTVRFQKVWTGTINPNEINFRIQAGYTDELIRGTKCDPNARVTRQYSNNN